MPPWLDSQPIQDAVGAPDVAAIETPAPATITASPILMACRRSSRCRFITRPSWQRVALSGRSHTLRLGCSGWCTGWTSATIARIGCPPPRQLTPAGRGGSATSRSCWSRSASPAPSECRSPATYRPSAAPAPELRLRSWSRVLPVAISTAGPLDGRWSATPGAQDDVGDVWGAERRVDPRLDRV